jgi:NAD(P)-dependent dehydrogenase (short-subunit alcohol dehydrogenase family)
VRAPGSVNYLDVALKKGEKMAIRATIGTYGRMGRSAVLFLTSDDAAFITGQAIVVDGGQYRIG